jgi:hypothetical protein
MISKQKAHNRTRKFYKTGRTLDATAMKKATQSSCRSFWAAHHQKNSQQQFYENCHLSVRRLWIFTFDATFFFSFPAVIFLLTITGNGNRLSGL